MAATAQLRGCPGVSHQGADGPGRHPHRGGPGSADSPRRSQAWVGPCLSFPDTSQSPWPLPCGMMASRTQGEQWSPGTPRPGTSSALGPAPGAGLGVSPSLCGVTGGAPGPAAPPRVPTRSPLQTAANPHGRSVLSSEERHGRGIRCPALPRPPRSNQGGDRAVAGPGCRA